MNLHTNKKHMPRWVGSAVMVTVQLLLWTTQTGCSQLPNSLHVNNSDAVNSQKTANYVGGRRSNNLILNDLNNNSLFKKLKEKNAKSETVITTSQGKVKPKISKVQNQNMDNRVDQQDAASSSKQNNIPFKKEDLATHNQSLKKSKSLEYALNELDDLIIWLNAL